MSGSDNAGPPPEVTDLPDAAAVEQALQGRSPPYSVRFRQGDQEAEVEADEIQTRGNNTVEVHHDGRVTTVRAGAELEAIK